MVYTSKVTSSVEENTDILGSAISNVIMPNFGTTLESAIYVGSLCEEAYTDLMTSIGVNELAVYESTGAEIVYEAEDGKPTEEGNKLKDNVAGFFQKIWNAIKAMFEKAIAWFKEKIHTAKVNKADKIVAAWNKKRTTIPNDKTFGKGRYVFSAQLMSGTAQRFVNANNFVYTAAKNIANDIKNGNGGDIDVAAKFGDAFPVLKGIKSASDIKEAITKSYDIPEKSEDITTSWVDKNISTLKSIIVDGVDTQAIKKGYQTLKGEVNKLANEVKSGEGDQVKAKASAITKIMSYVSATNAAYIDLLKNRYNECNRIVASIGIALKFGKKVEATKGEDQYEEETSAKGESAIIAAVEEAFNW